jgi:glycosyltransferase involved in cell wall biosynthesis
VVYFDASHSEMPNYMNAADVVVLPSISTPKWKEQYGRVIPEAMACAKIVVGSDSGTIPELISDAGFTFPEGDAHKLAEVLRGILNSPEAELDGIRVKAKERADGELSTITQAEILSRLLIDSKDLRFENKGRLASPDDLRASISSQHSSVAGRRN